MLSNNWMSLELVIDNNQLHMSHKWLNQLLMFHKDVSIVCIHFSTA